MARRQHTTNYRDPEPALLQRLGKNPQSPFCDCYRDSLTKHHRFQVVSNFPELGKRSYDPFKRGHSETTVQNHRHLQSGSSFLSGAANPFLSLPCSVPLLHLDSEGVIP